MDISVSRVDEFLSRVIAGIEPTVKGHWRIARAFVKFENGPIRKIRTEVRDRQNGCQELGFLCIPDLDDASIGRRVQELEDIGSGGQDLPGNFYRIAESYDGLPIPSVSLGCCHEGHTQHCGTHRDLKCFNNSHGAILLVEFGRGKPGVGSQARNWLERTAVGPVYRKMLTLP